MGDVIIDGGTGANRLVVLDANGKIPALDGSAVTAIAGANFSTGTIPVARIDTGTTAGKVVKLDGNAKLPAVSGAALTGVVGATKSASDPTVSTNPSGGVGTEWQNTTSGEIYVCTDATAGENVWTNVGGHSGDIQITVEGSQYGYTYGGYNTSAPTNVDTIQKWSFSTDGNSTDVANLSAPRYNLGGIPSKTHGYSAGGREVSTYMDTLEKSVFASDSDMANVGNLIAPRHGPYAFHSQTYGYTSGGESSPQTTVINTIDKFTFASDANATSVGTMTGVKWGAAAVSDWPGGYGYLLGGNSPLTNMIEKVSFASDGNGVDTGADLTTPNLSSNGGVESATSGYSCGGYYGGARVDIQKISFASVANAVDVGDLTVSRYELSGCSSTSYGYNAGGGPPFVDVIEKFNTSTDGNSTDVGDLVRTIGYVAAVHY